MSITKISRKRTEKKLFKLVIVNAKKYVVQGLFRKRRRLKMIKLKIFPITPTKNTIGGTI